MPPAGALVPSAPQTGISAGPGRRPLVLVELDDEAGSEVDLAGDLDFAAQGLDVGFDQEQADAAAALVVWKRL